VLDGWRRQFQTVAGQVDIGWRDGAVHDAGFVQAAECAWAWRRTSGTDKLPPASCSESVLLSVDSVSTNPN
jgi:hypothetical protein